MNRAIITAVCLLALAACGGDGGADGTPAPEPLTAATTTPHLAATGATTAPPTTAASTITTPPASTPVDPDMAPLTMEVVDAYTMEPINRGVRASFDFYGLDSGTVTLAYSTNFGSNDHESIVTQRRIDAWNIAQFVAPYGVGLDLSIDDQRWIAPPELMTLVVDKSITRNDWIAQTEQP